MKENDTKVLRDNEQDETLNEVIEQLYKGVQNKDIKIVDISIRKL